MNDGGTAKEMLHMIMSGYNIAEEDGVVIEGEGEKGMGEAGVCAMEISGNAVPNGADNVIPVPSDRAGRSIPEFLQCSGVMKNMDGMEPLDFYELFPEDLIEYIQ